MFNQSSKSEKKIIKEIKIPIFNCFQHKYDKDILIEKDFFSKKEVGHLFIDFDKIYISKRAKERMLSNFSETLYEKETKTEFNSVDKKVPDEKQAKAEFNSVDKKVSDEKETKFKFIDEESIEKLLKDKRRIGRGATSIVYRVKNIFNGKGYLAIKILNDTFFLLMKPNTAAEINSDKNFWNDDDDDDDDDERKEEKEEEVPIEEVQRLYNEWELLSQLDHPNIIKTYGFYHGDKTHSPSIVLEYCKYNLEQAIGNLENIDLVKIVYQICQAMQYLHDNKVIHRDLKVKNILINTQKNVKICDFGISKFIDITNLSSMTHNIGTFIYMAPELFNNDSRINEKIDVYAFGVVLYFIVTKGKLPIFDQNNPLENHEIPEDVNEISQSIIKKCWSFSPENRPSFKTIIDTIVSNNFNLFDNINESISSLGL